MALGPILASLYSILKGVEVLTGLSGVHSELYKLRITHFVCKGCIAFGIKIIFLRFIFPLNSRVVTEI